MGELPVTCSNEKYCHRLHETGWEPLMLRRIKLCLIFGYKIISELVPFGETLFALYAADTAANSVSGHTRSIPITLARPRPIQLVNAGENPTGYFTFIIYKIWNKLSLPAESYSSLASFSASWDAVDWSKTPTVREQFS